MRYICLAAAIVLALPLTASAQQKRAADRGSNHTRAEQRRTEERQPPASASQLPWWEHQPPPAWEQKQTPAWERKQVPSWERTQAALGKPLPGWEQYNVARALLNQQHAQQYQAELVRHGRARQYRPSVVYALPPYLYYPNSLPTTNQFYATPPPPNVYVSTETYTEPVAPMGALRLEVEPKESLQIFVDGVYIGTPADLGDEIELAPGTRRIELRARGYRSLSFIADIVDGRSITYRGTLERDEAAQPSAPRAAAPAAVAPAPPAGSRIMYVIPGCYLGNVSPKNVTLRAGCDISKLTTISP